MAYLTEETKWEDGIFQIETTTPALGGADGPVNTAPRQLANRTKYLKEHMDKIETGTTPAKKATCDENGNNIAGTYLVHFDGINHNGIYRGKNWGTFGSVTEFEQFLTAHKVSEGLFIDLYLGDYFLLLDGTYNKEWEIGGFDTYYQKGDTAFTAHHLALIPKVNLFESYMNPTNDTTGGYYNSYMHQTVIPQIDSNMAKVLGNHLLSRKALLSNKINASAASGAGANYTGVASEWAWYDVKACLLSEVAVYGTRVFSSSFYDVGEDCEKLPIFQFKGHSHTRQWFWLRAVVSSSDFADADYYGNASSYLASHANRGVRPLICVG